MVKILKILNHAINKLVPKTNKEHPIIRKYTVISAFRTFIKIDEIIRCKVNMNNTKRTNIRDHDHVSQSK